MLIHPYDDRWPGNFTSIVTALSPALACVGARAEHVGSTAVPGLAAKPIIDIDLVYRHPDDFPRLRQSLEALGYRHHGDQGIPGREVFKRAAGEVEHPVLDRIAHHLYANRADGEELGRHLRLRDYLRRHPAARREYAALKHRLAATAGQDRKRYAQIKESAARSFIERCLRATND